MSCKSLIIGWIITAVLIAFSISIAVPGILGLYKTHDFCQVVWCNYTVAWVEGQNRSWTHVGIQYKTADALVDYDYYEQRKCSDIPKIVKCYKYESQDKWGVKTINMLPVTSHNYGWIAFLLIGVIPFITMSCVMSCCVDPDFKYTFATKVTTSVVYGLIILGYAAVFIVGIIGVFDSVRDTCSVKCTDDTTINDKGHLVSVKHRWLTTNFLTDGKKIINVKYDYYDYTNSVCTATETCYIDPSVPSLNIKMQPNRYYGVGFIFAVAFLVGYVVSMIFAFRKLH